MGSGCEHKGLLTRDADIEKGALSARLEDGFPSHGTARVFQGHRGVDVFGVIAHIAL
jgi:hypothetical protein